MTPPNPSDLLDAMGRLGKDQLNPFQLVLLMHLASGRPNSATMLAKRLDVSSRHIRDQRNELCERGLIAKIGKDRYSVQPVLDRLDEIERKRRAHAARGVSRRAPKKNHTLAKVMALIDDGGIHAAIGGHVPLAGIKGPIAANAVQVGGNRSAKPSVTFSGGAFGKDASVRAAANLGTILGVAARRRAEASR
jgi:hypothetical protein